MAAPEAQMAALSVGDNGAAAAAPAKPKKEKKPKAEKPKQQVGACVRLCKRTSAPKICKGEHAPACGMSSRTPGESGRWAAWPPSLPQHRLPLSPPAAAG